MEFPEYEGNFHGRVFNPFLGGYLTRSRDYRRTYASRIRYSMLRCGVLVTAALLGAIIRAISFGISMRDY